MATLADCFALSQVGEGRSINQDSYLLVQDGCAPVFKERAADETEHAFSGGEGVLLLGVADGVGGGRAGELASSFVLHQVASTISRLLEEAGSSAPAHARDEAAWKTQAEMLSWAVRLTEKALVRYARKRGIRRGMATTLSLAMVEDAVLTLVHAGDSRAYVLGERGLVQLTEDHTMARSWYENGPGQRGVDLPEEMVNVLENCLRSDGARVRPTVYQWHLAETDQLLICSDGVSSALSHAELEWILVTSSSSREAANRMVENARAAGSLDDTTALVAAPRLAPAAFRSGAFAPRP